MIYVRAVNQCIRRVVTRSFFKVCVLMLAELRNARWAHNRLEKHPVAETRLAQQMLAWIS